MRTCLIVLAVWIAARPRTLASQTPSTPATPVALVQQLYHDYAWEVAFSLPPRQWRGLTSEPRDILSKYFDDSLTTLILNDRACVLHVKGECNIDGSPIWADRKSVV